MFEHPASAVSRPGTKVNSWCDENRSNGPPRVRSEEWLRRLGRCDLSADSTYPEVVEVVTSLTHTM